MYIFCNGIQSFKTFITFHYFYKSLPNFDVFMIMTKFRQLFIKIRCIFIYIYNFGVNKRLVFHPLNIDKGIELKNEHEKTA